MARVEKHANIEKEIVSKVNKYAVLGVVGEGAYGVVLKCRDKDGKIVAIKKFKDTEDDEGTRKTILREVRLLRQLKHDNIVSLKDAFRRRRRLYLVFEYMQRNLLEALEDNPTGIDRDLIKVYIYQLCKAVEWCHRNNVVHRDIKPENLLVNLKPDPTLKLCDFGFARQLPSSKRTIMTDYVATRWYRSPELLLGYESYGKSVDIWAIGCIMGELIDAQPLFPGDSDIDQLYVIQKVMGPLTSEQKMILRSNKRFAGVRIPETKRPQTLAKRYHKKKIDAVMLEFMNLMLAMGTKDRFKINDALRHDYFDAVRDKPLIHPVSAKTARSSSCRSARSRSSSKMDISTTPPVPPLKSPSSILSSQAFKRSMMDIESQIVQIKHSRSRSRDKKSRKKRNSDQMDLEILTGRRKKHRRRKSKNKDRKRRSVALDLDKLQNQAANAVVMGSSRSPGKHRSPGRMAASRSPGRAAGSLSSRIHNNMNKPSMYTMRAPERLGNHISPREGWRSGTMLDFKPKDKTTPSWKIDVPIGSGQKSTRRQKRRRKVIDMTNKTPRLSLRQLMGQNEHTRSTDNLYSQLLRDNMRQHTHRGQKQRRVPWKQLPELPSVTKGKGLPNEGIQDLNLKSQTGRSGYQRRKRSTDIQLPSTTRVHSKAKRIEHVDPLLSYRAQVQRNRRIRKPGYY